MTKKIRWDLEESQLPPELHQFFGALQKAAPEVLAHPYWPYNTESEVKAAKALYVSRLRRARAGPHGCMYPGCRRRAISRSHVLPRRGVVDVIAEDGHVAGPRANIHEGHLEIGLLGVRQASVFAGFCEHDEQVFGRFERKNISLSFDDLRLQLFRTACRELRHSEILLSRLTESWLEFVEQHEERLRQSIFRHLSTPASEVSAETLEALATLRVKRPDVAHFLDLVATGRASLDDFRSDLYEPLARCVLDASAPFSIAHLEIDERIPLCLAGQGNFHVDLGDGAQEVRVLLNIWPRESTTALILGANSRHGDRLPYYLRELHQSPIQLLRAIEAWALHGTDHWFVSPSHWRSLTARQQAAVLHALKDTSRSLAHTPNCMLFPAIHERLQSDLWRRLN